MGESRTRRFGGLFATGDGQASEAPDAPAVISAPMLGKFIAYSLAYAYVFCMLAGFSYLPRQLFTFEEGMVCRICLLACGGAVFLVWRAVGRLASSRRRRAIDAVGLCASLLPVAAMFAMRAGAPVAVAYACWACAGFSLSLLYIKITPWICQVGRGSAAAFMGAGCLVGALVFLVASLLTVPADVVLTAALPFAAVVVGARAERGDAPVREGADAGGRRHARASWDAVLYTLVQCSGLGMGIYCLIAANESWAGAPCTTAVLIAASIALAGALLVVDWKKRRLIDEERVSRYLYAVMFAPIAAVVFFRENVALCVCGCVLVASMWVVALVGCASEAESARARNLRSQTALARGWGLSLLGIGAGMLAGFVGLRLLGAWPEAFGAIFAVAVLLVLAAVAVSSGPARLKAAPAWENRPDGLAPAALAGEAAPEGGAAGAYAVEGAEAAAGASGTEGVGEADVSGETDAAERAFADRCDVIGDAYGLSSRQREVFYLLVRGRDSKYIQSKLVISKGTADTHIHNIYRKLNVHSRQELLDLFEGDGEGSTESR